MSSGSKFYYQANESGALDQIYDMIGETIVYDTCVPNEITETVSNATIVLTKPDNPTWRKQVTTNSCGSVRVRRICKLDNISSRSNRRLRSRALKMA